MIHLNSRDPRPIYEQIMDNLRRLIISGGVAPGERLPSVRELAAQLAINPNTIQRAYRELENQGYLVTLPGKGTFAAENLSLETRRIDLLWQQLERAADELRFAGVTQDELIAKAQQAFDSAQDALRNGDWAAYGEYMDELSEYLAQLSGEGGSTSGFTDIAESTGDGSGDAGTEDQAD